MTRERRAQYNKCYRNLQQHAKREADEWESLTFLHLFDLLLLVVDGSAEQSEYDTGLRVHAHRCH